MKVYIAAPYQMRAEAKAFASELSSHGIGCTARWVADDSSAEMNDEWARNDLADVSAADALVALNPSQWASSGTGGRHVEFGFAYAINKPIVVLGDKTNIFHYLSDVVVTDSIVGVLLALSLIDRAA